MPFGGGLLRVSPQQPQDCKSVARRHVVGGIDCKGLAACKIRGAVLGQNEIHVDGDRSDVLQEHKTAGEFLDIVDELTVADAAADDALKKRDLGVRDVAVARQRAGDPLAADAFPETAGIIAELANGNDGKDIEIMTLIAIAHGADILIKGDHEICGGTRPIRVQSCRCSEGNAVCKRKRTHAGQTVIHGVRQVKVALCIQICSVKRDRTGGYHGSGRHRRGNVRIHDFKRGEAGGGECDDAGGCIVGIAGDIRAVVLHGNDVLVHADVDLNGIGSAGCDLHVVLVEGDVIGNGGCSFRSGSLGGNVLVVHDQLVVGGFHAGGGNRNFLGGQIQIGSGGQRSLCDLRPSSLRVILVIKAVGLIGVLGGNDLNGEIGADGKILILVARSLLHVQGEGGVGRRSYGGAVIQRSIRDQMIFDGNSPTDNVRQCADAHKTGAGQRIDSGSSGSGKRDLRGRIIHVDHVRQSGNSAVGDNAHFVLQGKVAGGGNHGVRPFGVAGFPLVIIERRLGRIGFYGNIVRVGRRLYAKVDIQRTGFDDVAGRSGAVGEPRIGGAEQHGEAERQRDHAGKQSPLRSLCLCHNIESFRLFYLLTCALLSGADGDCKGVCHAGSGGSRWQ